jgi:gas vesicle protein
MNGFTIGMLAGAGGYFLFATDHGRKVRQQIVQEWEEAKKNLVKDGVISSTNVSLREFLQQVFQNMSGQRLEVLEKDPTAPVRSVVLANHEVDQTRRTPKSVSKPVVKKAAPVTRKFKGV